MQREFASRFLVQASVPRIVWQLADHIVVQAGGKALIPEDLYPEAEP
jgi:hypothetical protein